MATLTIPRDFKEFLRLLDSTKVRFPRNRRLRGEPPWLCQSHA